MTRLNLLPGIQSQTTVEAPDSDGSNLCPSDGGGGGGGGVISCATAGGIPMTMLNDLGPGAAEGQVGGRSVSSREKCPMSNWDPVRV